MLSLSSRRVNQRQQVGDSMKGMETIHSVPIPTTAVEILLFRALYELGF